MAETKLLIYWRIQDPVGVGSKVAIRTNTHTGKTTNALITTLTKLHLRAWSAQTKINLSSMEVGL